MSEKIKVSELEASTTTNDSDLIMIVQENSNNELENFKQTRANFFAGLDLTNYVTNTDYATSSVGGVVKVSPQYKATNITSGGTLEATTKTYEQYSSLDNTIFISKGTLENVLNAKIGSIDSVLDTINGEVV